MYFTIILSIPRLVTAGSERSIGGNLPRIDYSTAHNQLVVDTGADGRNLSTSVENPQGSGSGNETDASRPTQTGRESEPSDKLLNNKTERTRLTP